VLGPRAPSRGTKAAAAPPSPVVIGTLVAMRPEDQRWQRLIAETVTKADRRGVA
jgi:hypothetical protein